MSESEDQDTINYEHIQTRIMKRNLAGFEVVSFFICVTYFLLLCLFTSGIISVNLINIFNYQCIPLFLSNIFYCICYMIFKYKNQLWRLSIVCLGSINICRSAVCTYILIFILDEDFDTSEILVSRYVILMEIVLWIFTNIQIYIRKKIMTRIFEGF